MCNVQSHVIFKEFSSGMMQKNLWDLHTFNDLWTHAVIEGNKRGFKVSLAGFPVQNDCLVSAWRCEWRWIILQAADRWWPLLLNIRQQEAALWVVMLCDHICTSSHIHSATDTQSMLWKTGLHKFYIVCLHVFILPFGFLVLLKTAQVLNINTQLLFLAIN